VPQPASDHHRLRSTFLTTLGSTEQHVLCQQEVMKTHNHAIEEENTGYVLRWKD
jgi:hypothetical protein